MRTFLALMVLLCSHFASAASAVDTLHRLTQTHDASANQSLPPPATVLKAINTPLTPTHSQYGLVYIFSSQCPFCQRFTPVLADFLRRHPLPTYSFSLDGRGLPSFEHPMPATPNITQHFFGTPRFIYPATFLVNLDTNKFTGLTYQAVSAPQLEKQYQAIMATPRLLQELE